MTSIDRLTKTSTGKTAHWNGIDRWLDSIDVGEIFKNQGQAGLIRLLASLKKARGMSLTPKQSEKVQRIIDQIEPQDNNGRVTTAKLTALGIIAAILVVALEQ